MRDSGSARGAVRHTGAVQPVGRVRSPSEVRKLVIIFLFPVPFFVTLSGSGSFSLLHYVPEKKPFGRPRQMGG
jgi:hypothetical protein